MNFRNPHCGKNNGRIAVICLNIQNFSQSLDNHFHEKLNFNGNAKIYYYNREIRITLLNIG